MIAAISNRFANTPSAARWGCCVSLLMLAGLAQAGEPRLVFGDWHDAGLNVSYFNPVAMPDDSLVLWFCAGLGHHDGVVGLPGPSLRELQRVAPAFDARVVRDYDHHRPERATPIISRASVLRLANGEHLCLAAIGPTYTGGATELYPALFRSPDGSAGSWQHLGPLAGEPAEWLEVRRAANQRIRCEGGTIAELADGRLRAWLHGYGGRMRVAEADTPEGPWRFVRDDQGEPIDVLAGMSGGWLFPSVSRVGDQWLITGGNAWPPTAIRGALSADGLQFQELTEPVLTPAQVVPGSERMKTVRLTTTSDGVMHAAANVWVPGGGWRVLVTTATWAD